MPSKFSPWFPTFDGTFSLAIHVDLNTPPQALLGIADWVHHLATPADRLEGLPFSEYRSQCTLTLHWGLEYRQTIIRRSGQTLDVYAADVDACNRLFWYLCDSPSSQTSEWHTLAEISDRVVSVDGVDLGYDFVDEGRGKFAAPALLDLVPGQGPVRPFVVPNDVTLAWMKAFIDYVARVSISSINPPLPRISLLNPNKGAIMVADHSEKAKLVGNQITLPLSTDGIRLLERLATIPTYPERPLLVAPAEHHRQQTVTQFHKTFQIPWEVDRLKEILNRDVLPVINSDVACIEVYASESDDILHNLEKYLANTVEQQAHNPIDVKVFPAYNQASHFGLNVFLSNAESELGSIESITIGIPTCPPDDNALERSSAWAPTVVPFDEWLAQNRPGISVSLSMISGEAFEFDALAGERQYCQRFTPLTTHLVMDTIYQGKHSRPETAGIRLVTKSGMKEWTTPTDTEAAFRCFLKVLPEITSTVTEAGRHALPLFGELTVDVFVSDPDRAPGTMSFSPLDELHEEIYFGALAHFEPIIQKLHPGNARAPGLIIPLIHERRERDTQIAVKTTVPDHDLTIPIPHRLVATEIHANLDGIEIETEDPIYGLEPTILPPGIRIKSKQRTVAAESVQHSLTLPHSSVHPDRVWPLSASIAQQTSALAWIEGKSFGGRPIPVILWAPQLTEGIVSPQKIARHLPSVLVVAGHHANEPSSTPASFRLAQAVAVQKPDVVVAIVPLENPDGAALYQRLSAEHPNWKLHAARFNMLGHEFALDYDRPSPFGESRVRPNMEAHISAAVVVDNHGVPAVPWVQPFSGRTSPPLFWLNYTYPSGLIYGIGDGDKVGRCPSEIVSPFWEAITSRLNRREDLTTFQGRLWRRYLRYGVDLAPQDYPSRTVNGWPFQSMDRATSSYRHTTLSAIRLITEVADEGADSKLFLACMEAHIEANLAVIEVLSDRSNTEVGRV